MTNLWQMCMKVVKNKAVYIRIPAKSPRQGPSPIDVPVPQRVKLVAMLWPHYEDNIRFGKSKPWTRMALQVQLVGNRGM
jgi:hypothetical protein